MPQLYEASTQRRTRAVRRAHRRACGAYILLGSFASLNGSLVNTKGAAASSFLGSWRCMAAGYRGIPAAAAPAWEPDRLPAGVALLPPSCYRYGSCEASRSGSRAVAAPRRGLGSRCRCRGTRDGAVRLVSHCNSTARYAAEFSTAQWILQAPARGYSSCWRDGQLGSGGVRGVRCVASKRWAPHVVRTAGDQAAVGTCLTLATRHSCSGAVKLGSHHHHTHHTGEASDDIVAPTCIAWGASPLMQPVNTIMPSTAPPASASTAARGLHDARRCCAVRCLLLLLAHPPGQTRPEHPCTDSAQPCYQCCIY